MSSHLDPVKDTYGKNSGGLYIKQEKGKRREGVAMSSATCEGIP